MYSNLLKPEAQSNSKSSLGLANYSLTDWRAPLEAPKPSGTVKITASALNVREAPGSSSAKLGTVVKNQIVDYTDAKEEEVKIPMARGDRWLKIKFNGKDGWISEKYVTPVGKPAAQEEPKTSQPEVKKETKAEEVTSKEVKKEVEPSPAASNDWRADVIKLGLKESDIYEGTEKVGWGAGSAKAVKTLQALLNRAMNGYGGKLNYDGWGKKTMTSLMYYQLSSGLWKEGLGRDAMKLRAGVCNKEDWDKLRAPSQAFDSAAVESNSAYRYGKPLEMKPVKISHTGSSVNAINEDAAKAYEVFRTAAQACGRDFSIASSFRAMTRAGTINAQLPNHDGQIELYAQNKGNTSLAAVPGFGPHQRGGAIDFNGCQVYENGSRKKDANGKYVATELGQFMRDLTTGKYDAKLNAEQIKARKLFENYKVEPWHYDYVPSK